MDRRGFIKTTLGAGALLAVSANPCQAQDAKPKDRNQGRNKRTKCPWPLTLNASTIRPTPLKDKIRIADEAGFDGIELWVGELEEFVKSGGDLKALRKEIEDRGLYVPNVIGLWDCMPMDEPKWKESLDATRHRMDLASQVGSLHVAAIPSPDRPDFDLKWGADRYRDLLKIGREEFDIIVAAEFVGFMKGVHRLGQAAAMALDADDPDACLVMDTFHLYRGGSGFEGLKFLRGNMMAVFHWNDVPAEPARETLGDEHRIMPGDGILPLRKALRTLREVKYEGPLSLEIFNQELWKRDPREVADLGLAKMRRLIETMDESA